MTIGVKFSCWLKFVSSPRFPFRCLTNVFRCWVFWQLFELWSTQVCEKSFLNLWNFFLCADQCSSFLLIASSLINLIGCWFWFVYPAVNNKILWCAPGLQKFGISQAEKSFSVSSCKRQKNQNFMQNLCSRWMLLYHLILICRSSMLMPLMLNFI